jgi:small conductance mechanosensitive channel
MTGIFIALEILNLDKTVSSLLAGAGVIGLAIGFAFQEIASNFIAGILIAIRKPFQVGDILEVKDNVGKVSDIDLRTTRLLTFDGLEVIIPNKDMFTSVITNYTATSDRRISLEVGISYAEDLRRVKKIALAAMEDVSLRVKDKEVEIFYTGFGDSAITFEVRIWITSSDPRSAMTATDDVVVLMKEAFDKNDILIPFPIRTLDFGIKGGENLSQVLSKTASLKN